ncbi:MAG: hypothetical protein QOG42_1920, partial [Solirubrobacteraceae bacterium]|nr:hypothetical protein [Solirubrobacteraceae bacterium]
MATQSRRRAILGAIDLRPPVRVVSAVLCALLLGACGSGQSDKAEPAAGTTTTQPAAPQPQPQPGSRGRLALPRSVPLRESGAGDPAAIRVIRLWSDALRRSDVARASALWAIP